MLATRSGEPPTYSARSGTCAWNGARPGRRSHPTRRPAVARGRSRRDRPRDRTSDASRVCSRPDRPMRRRTTARPRRQPATPAHAGPPSRRDRRWPGRLDHRRIQVHTRHLEPVLASQEDRQATGTAADLEHPGASRGLVGDVGGDATEERTEQEPVAERVVEPGVADHDPAGTFRPMAPAACRATATAAAAHTSATDARARAVTDRRTAARRSDPRCGARSAHRRRSARSQLACDGRGRS